MRTLTCTLLVLFLTSSYGNKRASEIYLDLQKLRSLNKVLYIAAHPDDENTRFLAYMSLGEKAETAYLSLTRGDGGQNLIGDELSEKLGVLRTQELLAARSYDGANQFFSRAVDFGYSKSADETFDIWGKEEVLSDVVLIIRQFRPDIIVTRFPPDKRGGHGHHTASCMLAIEAFEKAADPNFLPDQVEKYGTWETTSLYWNTSYWWMKSIEDSMKAHPDMYFKKDIGGYSPLLGMSYNEIGTIARSQHKCQGFGAVTERGSRPEYFEYIAGKRIENEFFEHSSQSWSSEVSPKFETELNTLIENFNFQTPEKNVPALLDIRKGLSTMENQRLMEEKLTLCDQIIFDCLGLYIEVLGNDFSYATGDSLELELQALNRSSLPIKANSVSVNGIEVKNIQTELVSQNTLSSSFSIMPQADFSTPYWLREPFKTMFTVKDESNLGRAENVPTLLASINLSFGEEELTYECPVQYKWRDPSYGERRRELICTPAFSANFENDLILLKAGETKTIRIQTHAFKEGLKDQLHIVSPKGWTVEPSVIPINADKKHEENWHEVKISVNSSAGNGQLILQDKNENPVMSYEEIAYDHIPTQSIISPAQIKCILLNANIEAGKVAYIKGVDDAVGQAISQLGFEVDYFEVKDLADLDLSPYRSVVLGIRIYNVHPELRNHDKKLFDYVYNGGNLIMQYNTASRSLRNQEFGPIPFKLSRNRVTDEYADVTFLSPKHQIMNSPNKISKQDFEGWVQERGLYFADGWSEEYTPLFAWNDKGEDPKKGALIVAQHGKGQFIYTGISFFRELPKGVTGAYRLFANMLSYKSE